MIVICISSYMNYLSYYWKKEQELLSIHLQNLLYIKNTNFYLSPVADILSEGNVDSIDCILISTKISMYRYILPLTSPDLILTKTI